jgi:magnesium chelatase family protein
VRRQIEIDADGRLLLERAVQGLGLSARAHDRILRVARTIADLEDEPRVLARHLAEAIHYRTLDRRLG